MSTPMNVPCIASRRLARRQVGAATRIACQASARTNIAAHITASPASEQAGLGGEQRGGDAGDADVLQRQRGEPGAQQRAAGEPETAQRARATGAIGGGRRGRLRLQRGQALSGNARQQIGGREAVPHRGRALRRVVGAPTASACS